MHHKQRGGDLLDAGGFGCVFNNPALKGVGKPRDHSAVSKLMIKKYALEEHAIITKVKSKLSALGPAALSDYFVLDVTVCVPDKLTEDDLDGVNKCEPLNRRGILRKNINSKLDQLRLLLMPYGGVPVKNHLDALGETLTSRHIVAVGDALVELLQKGIVPMNRANVYHLDIKESNILIQSAVGAGAGGAPQSTGAVSARIIDWGVSVVDYLPDGPRKNDMMKYWANRPYQFNTPIAVILFSDEFGKAYRTYLADAPKAPMTPQARRASLGTFVATNIREWFADSHYDAINEIMGILFAGNDTVGPPSGASRYPYTAAQAKAVSGLVSNADAAAMKLEREYTLPIITHHLVEILIEFTDDSSRAISGVQYLNDVYLQIVDVYGLVMSYLPIIEILRDNFDELSSLERKLFDSLVQIFSDYLFEPILRPYDLAELVNDLGAILD